MRFHTPLLASVLVVGMASAQQVNLHEHGYCGSTSYTSRNGVSGASDGWGCYNWDAEHLRGTLQTLGDPAGPNAGQSVTSIKTFYCVMQDQDVGSVEQFKIGVFLDDPAMPGNPDPNVDPLTSLPTPAAETGFLQNNAGTAGTAGAWGWTVTFTTPLAAAIPADQSFHLAGFMPANPGWGSPVGSGGDGISYHGSWFTSGGSGDAPGSNAVNGIGGAIVNCTNSIDITAGNAVGSASNTHQMRVAAGTLGTTLRLGADIAGNTRSTVNPNYGYGGIEWDTTDKPEVTHWVRCYVFVIIVVY